MSPPREQQVKKMGKSQGRKLTERGIQGHKGWERQARAWKLTQMQTQEEGAHIHPRHPPEDAAAWSGTTAPARPAPCYSCPRRYQKMMVHQHFAKSFEIAKSEDLR